MYGTGGVSRALVRIRTQSPTDTNTASCPVDQGEDGVVHTKYDGQVEVLDVDRSGSDHDVHQTGQCVDTMQEHVQNVHPSSLN